MPSLENTGGVKLQPKGDPSEIILVEVRFGWKERTITFVITFLAGVLAGACSPLLSAVLH